ncbi:polysaccharide biosynthesis C-terminal domain-containing protein [Halomarina salina]|uniref:Polysaccharide biosynthesis C-terminal domain-containing protein n=1 Tax=Halomarina salina TaxID=1872699 RepID=A0ABD5RKB4_9EURY|nr:polysaccharide biosynthesis C-terminal domain-containing protein [Halomarina salina]
MSVSRSSLKLFAGSVGTTLMTFLALAYFARELGSAQLGVFFLFQAALSMLVMGADLGIGTAVEKRISAGEGMSVFWSGAALVAGLAGTLALGVVLLRGVVSGYLGADLALLLAVALTLMAARRLLDAALRGSLRAGELAGLSVLRLGVQYGLAAALVWNGMDVYALVFGLLAGLAAANSWAVVKLRPAFARPTRSDARSLLGYAKYNAIPSVGLEVHNWMDVLIIGVFLTQSDVGAYEIAWRVAGVTTLLAGSIGVAIMPQASAWDAEGSTDRVGELVSAAFTPALVFVLPAVAGVAVLGEDILGLLFGPEFTSASLVLVVLVAGKTPEAVQMVVGRTLLGLDRPDLVARATVVSLVCNLLLNVTLVLWLGLVGAALATTLSFTVGTALRVHYLGTFVPLSIPLDELVWCGVAAAVMGGVLAVLHGFVVVQSLTVLVGFVVLGAVIYGLLVLAHGSLRGTLFGYVRSFLPNAAF